MIVLIPAYRPDTALPGLVARLHRHTVVVVDDGSGPAHAGIFDKGRALGATVLTLDRNQGKGFALKTGFAYARSRFPGRGVVCADCDGQHEPADIEAVARAVATSGADLVLGVRHFTGAVPARSRLGNTVSRAVFRLVTGVAVADTQTGLRGYPARMLPWLGTVPGDRFDYEQRLLLAAARERQDIAQVAVATVYRDHNASSHFRPIRDSFLVLRPLLAFAGSSLLAFAVDTTAMLGLFALTGSLAASAVAARVLSAGVNYSVNRRCVFRSRGSALRYAALALLLLTANVILLEALTMTLGSVVAAKLLTEVVLFTTSFLVQRAVVFGGSDGQPGRRLDDDRVEPVPGGGERTHLVVDAPAFGLQPVVHRRGDRAGGHAGQDLDHVAAGQPGPEEQLDQRHPVHRVVAEDALPAGRPVREE